MMLISRISIFGAVLMLFYTSAQCSKDVYKLEIKERGTQFDEEVEIDRKDGTVLYKVPAHNDIAKSDVLFDYEAGYFATRIPKMKECYIQSIPQDRMSSRKEVKKNLQLYEMLNSSEPIPVRTIKNSVIKEGRISKTELNASFSAFCGDYEVYRVKQINGKSAFQIKRKRTMGKDVQKRSVKDITNYVVQKSIVVHVYSPTTGMVAQPGRVKKLTLNTCKPLRLYDSTLTRGGCIRNSDSWVFHCHTKTESCIYTAKCKGVNENGGFKIRCEEEHFFTGWLCCDVACT